MATRFAAELEHLTQPTRLHFPTEETVPESKRHLEIRTLLYQLLKLELASRAWLGSEQFVYWNASNPKRCLSPDVFARRGGPDVSFDSWKTWERGAPEVCVEIVSPSDQGEAAWGAKFEKYRELGVIELVRFDPDDPPGRRLRVWDRLEDDLIERVVAPDERTPATVLGLTWVVAPADDEPVALRLSRDSAGRDLLPTPNEAREAEVRAREAEVRAREAEARAREAAERARETAERRVAELEAELAHRR